MKKPSDKRIAVGTVCGGVFPIPDIGIPLRLGTLPWDKCMTCSQAGCRSLLCEEGAGQQEDIDALPVKERAAIYCSLNACCHAHVAPVHLESMRIAGQDAESVALATWHRFGSIGPLSWAEAEARLRTRKVRP